LSVKYTDALDHHDDKREEPEEYAPHRHPFVAEQQRLAQENGEERI
jgi:hypothetical protein